jgi:uncharacterized iron-regulated membrane protein
LWFGLIGLSGSVLAWLPDLISYEMRVRHPYEITSPNQPQIPLSQAIAQLRKTVPDITPKELSSAILPNERYPFYLFSLRREDAVTYKIDPYSGTVHPPYRKSDLIIGNIANFHEMLLLGPKGLIANGVASFFAVFMLLSGLWLWWPSTMRQLKIRLSVKRGASWRRQLMDLHNVLGIYLFVVVFLTTATAVFMAYNSATDDGLEKSINSRAGVLPEKPLVVRPQKTRLTDDLLLARAKEVVPDVPSFSVRRPVKPTDPFQVTFASQRGLLRGVTLVLDPYNGQVLKLERSDTASPGHNTVHLMEDLHFGFFGGVATKLLYTFAGLMPMGLFITGLWMWWKRKQAEKQAVQKRRTKLAASTP